MKTPKHSLERVEQFVGSHGSAYTAERAQTWSRPWLWLERWGPEAEIIIPLPNCFIYTYSTQTHSRDE